MNLTPDDRSTLAQSLRGTLDPTADPLDNDAALVELGWHDMVESGPDAVGVVFEVLGMTGSSSTVLDDVVAVAAGLEPGSTVGLPRWGSAERPATIALGSARLDTQRLAGLRPVAGIDPELGFVECDASLLLFGDEDRWPAVVTAARAAIGAWLFGMARAMLEMARTHAVDRTQFGRPIGSFQAVRHKLADVHVAIEAADPALAAVGNGTLDSDLARVLTGQAAAVASMHCQQILAGVGFTEEHGFHRYMKRAMFVDGLFGTTSSICAELGRGLLRDNSVPRTVQLQAHAPR